MPKPIRPILLVSILDQISITIAFPVLTFICFDVHTRLFAPEVGHAVRSLWYGILFSIPHFVAIVAAPVLAALSDHFGRKNLMLFGAAGAVVFCAFAAAGVIYGNILLVVLGGVICGICVRTEPIATAAIGDISSSHNKIHNMGYLQFAISVGACLGPVLGGYLAQKYFFAQLNFSMPYLIGAAIGILTVILTKYYFKETLPIAKTKPKSCFIPLWQTLALFKNRAILKISFILILIQISWRLYYLFMPTILKIQFNNNPRSIGLFMGLIALWLIIASLAITKIIKKSTPPSVIIKQSVLIMLLGFGMVLAGIYLNLGFYSKILIWSATIPIAAGDVIAYCATCTLYSDAVSINDQGKIMGINFILVSLIWSLTSLAGGALGAINFKLPLLIAPVSLVVLLLFKQPKT